VLPARKRWWSPRTRNRSGQVALPLRGRSPTRPCSGGYKVGHAELKKNGIFIVPGLVRMIVAVEKLNGTNVKILVEKGRLVEMQNRKNVLDPRQILDGRTFILEGVLNSAAK
jgi:hypothetical protein